MQAKLCANKIVWQPVKWCWQALCTFISVTEAAKSSSCRLEGAGRRVKYLHIEEVLEGYVLEKRDGVAVSRRMVKERALQLAAKEGDEGMCNAIQHNL